MQRRWCIHLVRGLKTNNARVQGTFKVGMFKCLITNLLGVDSDFEIRSYYVAPSHLTCIMYPQDLLGTCFVAQVGPKLVCSCLCLQNDGNAGVWL